jgi:hypothetical protein
MVNGDDALLMQDDEGYESWKSLTHSVGLEMSVGKNYFSKEVVVLNSQLYKFDRLPQYFSHGDLGNWADMDDEDDGNQWYLRPTPDHEFSRIPYWNMGLVCGQKRVLRVDNTERDEFGVFKTQSLGSQCHNLVKYIHDPSERDALISRFIVFVRRTRKPEPTGRNQSPAGVAG